MRIADRVTQLPPYLFAELERKIEEKRAAGVDVISLGIGDPDLPTPAAVVEEGQRQLARPDTHQYPSNRGRPAFRQARGRLLPAPLRRRRRPRHRGAAAAGRQGGGRAHLLGDARPRRRLPGGGPRLPGLHVRLAAVRSRAGADAADRRARVPAEPGRDHGAAARPRQPAVLQLPEQPHRGRDRRRLLRTAGPLRPRAPDPDRARQRLLGDHLRRLRGAQLPAGAGRQGGGHRDVLAVQGLQHDRLADRRRGRQRRP